MLWRGVITKLSVSPYDIGQFDVGFKVACTKHRGGLRSRYCKSDSNSAGVYFVREFDTEAKCHSESAQSDYQRRAGYAGYKFEQVVTVEDLGGKPDTSAPVDPNNEFIGMFKCNFD